MTFSSCNLSRSAKADIIIFKETAMPINASIPLPIPASSLLNRPMRIATPVRVTNIPASIAKFRPSVSDSNPSSPLRANTIIPNAAAIATMAPMVLADILIP